MKRLLTFDFIDGEYVIQENHLTIFSISGETLKFDSLKFYKGIYNSGNESTLIEFNNEIKSDPLKKGNYIFQWINDIVSNICAEFNETDTEALVAETIPMQLKRIHLYDMTACAGDGLYIFEEDVPYTEIDVNNCEADYALKISGHSMEPTISDGSVVLVKKTENLENSDIGIFNVNGDSICKRYTESQGNILLVPDNTCGSFKTIEITADTKCIIQGKVVEVI